MDLALSDEQALLVDSFADLFAKGAALERVRAAEPVGHDPDLWERLGTIGSTATAVPEDAGGWGASLLDLALVAEVAGRFVAPAPLIETQVSARLLAAVARDSDLPAAVGLLHDVLRGTTIATL